MKRAKVILRTQSTPRQALEILEFRQVYKTIAVKIPLARAVCGQAYGFNALLLEWKVTKGA